MISAEFMDIFGILAFIIILVIGIVIKIKRKKLPNNILDWMAIGLIIVGILGLSVDVVIVVRSFILGWLGRVFNSDG